MGISWAEARDPARTKANVANHSFVFITFSDTR
jgi:hypothetical protein